MKRILLFFPALLFCSLIFGQDGNEPNDNFGDATHIVLKDLEASLEGAISQSGDVDYFAVEVAQAGVLVIDVSGIPGNLGLGVQLYNPRQGSITNKSNTNAGPVHLEYLACEVGTYYFQIYEVYGQANVGSYSLKVSLDTKDGLECNNAFEDASRIPLDKAIEATIRNSGDVDIYAIEIDRAGVLMIDINSIPQELSLATQVYDYQHKPIPNAYKQGPNGIGIDLEQLVCDPGIYYISVYDIYNASSESTYSIEVSLDSSDRLECNNNFDDASLISLDTTIEASIRNSGDLDYYEIIAPREGVMVIDVTSIPSSISLGVQLYSGRQEPLVNKQNLNGGPVRLEYLVCDPGPYFFALYDIYNTSEAESYSLRVTFDTADVYECNNSLDEPTAIQLCDTIYGAIYAGGDQDYYGYEAEAGDTILLMMIDIPSSLSLQITTYDNLKRPVTSQYVSSGSKIELPAEAVGTYYFSLSDIYGNRSNQTYELILSSPTGCSTTSTNQILTEGVIQLSPNPTQDNITVTYGSHLADKQPTLRIFDADGRQLADYPWIQSGRSLDLTGLPNGLLLFQFRVDGEMTTLRVVKEGR